MDKFLTDFVPFSFLSSFTKVQSYQKYIQYKIYLVFIEQPIMGQVLGIFI